MVFNIKGVNIINVAIKDTSDAIRALLTTSGAAYDAATVGNFVGITSTEYAALASSLTGVSKYGMSDAQVAETGSSWTAYCASVLPSSYSSINAGNYIVAVTVRSQTSTITPLFNTVHPGSNSSTSFTAIANSVTISATNGQYYLVRKRPSAVASNGFLGHAGGSTGFLLSGTTSYTGSGVNNGYYACVASAVPPFTPWTARSGTHPMVQWLVTTTQTW